GNGTIAVWDLNAVARRARRDAQQAKTPPPRKRSNNKRPRSDDRLRPERLLRGHRAEVMALAINADGQRMVSGAADGQVRLWDLSNTEVNRPLHVLSNHHDRVAAVAITPSGDRIASGGWDHSVRIWDAAQGTALHHLTAHHGPITDLAFSPDAHLLASASADRTVRLWSVATGQLLATLSAIGDQPLAWTPSGHFATLPTDTTGLHLTEGVHTFSLDQLPDLHYDPSIVAQTLQGQATHPNLDALSTPFKPPRITLQAHPPSTQSSHDDLTVEFAVDTPYGLRRLVLWRNGHRVRTFDRLPNVGVSQLLKTFTLAPLPGPNTLQIEAIDTRGLSTRSTPITTEVQLPPLRPSLHVIAIATGSSNTMAVPNAVRDTEMVLRALSGRARRVFSDIHPHTMLFADQQTLQNHIDTLAQTTRPHDVVLIYFSGPATITDDRFHLALRDGSITTDTIDRWIATLPSERIALLLDPRYHGDHTTSQAVLGRSVAHRDLGRLALSTGAQVLLGPWLPPMPEKRHGVWTQALIDGLRGRANQRNRRDHTITVGELHAWLLETVPKTTANLYDDQVAFPMGWGQDPNMVLTGH
ncbi:MAG: WD40 repeat domain-containing protein, partial [Myxococcota bacterium]